MPKTKLAMGLDIGGTGIKGAVVDVKVGELVSDRVRIKTPKPSTPEAVMATAARVREELGWSGPVGCGFPGLIKKGIVTDAPNLDPSWARFDIIRGLNKYLGRRKVTVLNDADAAGLAEVRFGAGSQPWTNSPNAPTGNWPAASPRSMASGSRMTACSSPSISASRRRNIW